MTSKKCHNHNISELIIIFLKINNVPFNGSQKPTNISLIPEKNTNNCYSSLFMGNKKSTNKQ